MGRAAPRLAEASLGQLPREAEVVVWLLYALGPKTQPPVLEVGGKVSLFDAEWLGSAMEIPGNAGLTRFPTSSRRRASRASSSLGPKNTHKRTPIR